MWNKITIIAHKKINEVSCSVRNTSLDSHLAMEVTQTDLRRTLAEDLRWKMVKGLREC